MLGIFGRDRFVDVVLLHVVCRGICRVVFQEVKMYLNVTEKLEYKSALQAVSNRNLSTFQFEKVMVMQCNLVYLQSALMNYPASMRWQLL